MGPDASEPGPIFCANQLGFWEVEMEKMEPQLTQYSGGKRERVAQQFGVADYFFWLRRDYFLFAVFVSCADSFFQIFGRRFY